MMWRGSLTALVLLVAGALCGVADASVIAAGRWFTDGQGRVLTPHGVAVMNFRPPHLPESIGFGGDDAAFLAAHGFEVVRVGFNWEGIEPRPGVYDEHQVASLRRTIRVLQRHGIASILDAHQDGYGSLTGTDGAPAWATRSDGAPNAHLAFGVDYFANPAVLRAFDNLYANAAAPDGAGLADHYAAMWAHIAAATRHEHGLLGYELINEPYPGSQYATCVVLLAGCPVFDAILSRFYRRVTARLRAIDAQHLVFYEPNLFFDFGPDTRLADPSGGRPGGAFAFHDYCLGAGAGDALPPIPGNAVGCPIEEKLVIDNALRYSVKSSQPVINTEWAATDDLGVTARVADELDAGMVPWTFWNYNSPRLVSDLNKPPAGANLNSAALAILDRPHPRAVAGTPIAYGWDAVSRRATIAYSTTPPVRSRPLRSAVTTIWIGDLHYPRGYAVAVSGATVISRPGGRLLKLRNEPGAARVSATITPRS